MNAKDELQDAGILSHEEKIAALRTALLERTAETVAVVELAECQAKEIDTLTIHLEAMTRARDGWRNSRKALFGHAIDCASAGDAPCNCPAALDAAAVEPVTPQPDHATLEALAQRELGEEAKVVVLPRDPLPAWTDLDGIEHPQMPVVRVEIRIGLGGSFGMEGPEIAAPGFVAYMAAQLKAAQEASPIIVPPPGFKP